MFNVLPFKSREQKMLDQFVERNREAALVLVPGDPETETAAVSKFGGLPLLSDSHAWPRGPTGNALHFLAQIDCAELPWHGQLPSEGVLTFFGRDDDEQLWLSDDEDPATNCVVLYDDENSGKRLVRLPPEELAPIGDGWRGAPQSEQLSIDGKYVPHDRKVHVQRPIEFHSEPVMTLPPSIYDGTPPLAKFGTSSQIEGLFAPKSSRAAKQSALENRLMQLLGDRQREFLVNVANEVFGTGAHSSQAYGTYSQLLGHPNQSQDTHPPMENAVCLLNIASDNASGFTFGDCGFCTFWISAPDLARRDFSKVRGQIEGG